MVITGRFRTALVLLPVFLVFVSCAGSDSTSRSPQSTDYAAGAVARPVQYGDTFLNGRIIIAPARSTSGIPAVGPVSPFAPQEVEPTYDEIPRAGSPVQCQIFESSDEGIFIIEGEEKAPSSGAHPQLFSQCSFRAELTGSRPKPLVGWYRVRLWDESGRLLKDSPTKSDQELTDLGASNWQPSSDRWQQFAIFPWEDLDWQPSLDMLPPIGQPDGPVGPFSADQVRQWDSIQRENYEKVRERVRRDRNTKLRDYFNLQGWKAIRPDDPALIIAQDRIKVEARALGKAKTVSLELRIGDVAPRD